MRDMIPAALIAVLAVPAAAQSERGPDGHMVGPQRGDVIDVRGEPAPACAKRAGSRYAAPYRGWRYKPLAAGDRLKRLFYGTRYVIARPARYRLPAPGANRRWIRYGEDAVLVDVRSGRVLRVLANRCW